MANIYRGFSTQGRIRPPYTLTDGELIKTDLLNELKAKKGERVMRPSFGTRIEDILMNPLDKFLIKEVEDEVRRVGASMDMDPTLLGRHPFPGPGLAIRILGDITAEKVRILQEVDAVFINGLREWGLYDKVWQAGAMLLPVHSVGVMGDERTYEKCVALRAVESTDGMTADWVNLPYEFLQKTSNEIINKVPGVNRVVYDISSKPPATIEWE